MIPIASAETAKLATVLRPFAPRATITRTAGLLTAPNLQANTVRLELLVHLAVAHCAGKQKPREADLARWLNRYLGQTQSAMFEDPVEDVFITNVATLEGNRRIFESIWEANDYFLQVVLDILSTDTVPRECRELLKPAYALLRLSDCLAERLGLNRWLIEPSTSKGFVPITRATRVGDRARAVTFTNDDLKRNGTTRDALSPFVLRNEDKERLISESTGDSSLDRRPLVDLGDVLVVALPHAVSPAIRRFVLSGLRQIGYLRAFESKLASHQASQVEHTGLWELKRQTTSFHPPEPKIKLQLSLHSWLLKYDINKYIHIVLLHDRLDQIEKEGMSSVMKYPDAVKSSLQEYLKEVAIYCKDLPDCSEGMTLLILGGLGRGFVMGFKEWPDGWCFSFISLPDLLMVASEIDQPIKRYMKCIKQKVWVEGQGVNFMNINGDFNFYSYWRRFNYRLIPQDTPIAIGTMIVVANDFLIRTRQEIRNLIDVHVLQMTSGVFVQVMRFGSDAYFKSLQSRPIYASLGHLRSGLLAAAVETPRGPSWLLIESNKGDKSIRRVLYEIWSGFLGLYDRLVAEVEALTVHTSPGAIELRLNFEGAEIPKDYVPLEGCNAIAEPELLVYLDRREAEVKFPPDFFLYFQSAENIGEKYALRAIAQCLLRLHESDATLEDSLTERLLDKVIGDKGIRVLHLFNTYYPVEHLLARQEQETVFLAREDFAFATLMLSDGCVPAGTGSVLDTKFTCNDFLHKIVSKVWLQLRDLLRQFDRTSVVKQVLAVHEAVINDRDRWRRTAQAVIALHGPFEDIFAVARDRDIDRNQIAVSARTTLEMAICECPTVGGRELSRWELDELLARALLLIETATDSDAMNGGLIEPITKLHANGEYTVDRSFYETIIHPFVANYFREEFERAAGDYSKFYRREKTTIRLRADEIFKADFINAFNTEFGLTPDEALDGFAELMEFALECDSVVIETSLGRLTERLTHGRGLSPRSCRAFLQTFGLFHRPAWDQPPVGFSNKDLSPWRFRRRLSSTVRPLLVFGEQEDDKILYGAGALESGFRYLIDRTENGQLPSAFFATSEMRKYIGAVNNERGHDFARSVAAAIRAEGWQVRSEVQMTELGASSELGDIDVLAWKTSGELLLIECKRLQLARTVAEIAEICRRFRGEAKDELHKHVRRGEWVIQHVSSLDRIVGFTPERNNIDSWLITNTHVPIMYLTGLPVAAEKIGPLTRLVRTIVPTR